MEYPQSTWKAYERDLIPYRIELERSAVGAALLSEFKEHVRVADSSEDALLVRMLNTAARALEDDTRRLLITGTVKEYYDIWPWDFVSVVHLHRCPVVSLTSIKYYDTDDNQQTWDSANYETDLINEPARIVIAENATLDSPNIDQRPNCVVLEYECGYGTTVSNVDPEAINAIFVKAAYLYGCGRELMQQPGTEAAVERCWQNELRRLYWSAS